VLIASADPPRGRGTAVASVPLVAVAAGVIVVSASRRPTLAATSYGGGSAGRFALDLVAAAALVAASVIASDRARRLVLSLLLVGLLWTVPDWAGWTDAGPVTTFVSRGSAVVLPAMALLASGSVVPVPPRLWTRAAGLVVAASLVAALNWNSFAEPGCWRACLAPAADPLGGGKWLLRAVLVATVALAALLPVLVLRSPGWRHEDLLASLASLPLTVSLAAQVLPVTSVADSATGPPRTWAFAVAQASALGLVLGVCWGRARSWATSVRLNRLAGDLHRSSTPSRLEATLAAAVKDPALTIGWWSETRAGWVDAGGADVPMTAPEGTPGNDGADGATRRAVTLVTSRGRRIAAVNHRASLPVAGLVRSLRPAMLLSFDTARLQAATRAELTAARATAQRLVERSESERRELRGNLHDGAQQGLVGLAMTVRRVRSHANTAVPLQGQDIGATLDRADALVHEALAQVRAIAHDIHPPLLADLGLGFALQELADTSTQVVVRVADERGPALTPAGDRAAAEAAAYAAAQWALSDAGRRHASNLQITLRREPPGVLEVRLLDDGDPDPSPGAAPSIDDLRVEDRVSALAGELRLAHRPGALRPERLERP
jgi:signal transduction histidine kinase